MSTTVPGSSNSSRPTSTTTSAPAKPPTRISPEALISDKAVLTGIHPITIAATAIIHPFVRIDSSSAPIEISDGAVVWERAVIGSASISTGTPSNEAQEERAEERITRVAGNAVVHQHAHIGSGASIGEHAQVEVGARVGQDAELGAWAKVGTCAEIGDGEVVPAYTTVYLMGERTVRRVNTAMLENEKLRELTSTGHARELAVLRRVVKNGVGKWTS